MVILRSAYRNCGFYRCVGFTVEGVISIIDVSSVKYRTPVMLMKEVSKIAKMLLSNIIEINCTAWNARRLLILITVS